MYTFECTSVGCEKVFSAKRNMTRRVKSYDNVKIQCALCPKSFPRIDNHGTRVKIIHFGGMVALPTIFPDMQTGPPNAVAEPWTSTVPWTTDEENDELFMIIDMVIYDDRKRVFKEETAAEMKKARIELAKTPGFPEVDSSFSREKSYADKNVAVVYMVDEEVDNSGGHVLGIAPGLFAPAPGNLAPGTWGRTH
ncbi:Hypothetical protein CINCED_3A006299 [Cinara cedri]|uniref:Uncharacterized protein n=1 Tax=Cinara cedri TaxID=506608 RepID=A0A5E4NFI1_9HEMI|nr:Hypothetical protein CINCED_3A006299 [Cinara cedri]